MKHVAEGGLPPHLEEQRTRMFVQSAAPQYTETVESASAYMASGLENTFSLDRFRRDFRVEVQSMSEEQIVFDLIGIDAALANAFRRILLAEVPTMAIEKVFVLNNTSMIQDEILAHRLGLIPIRADPREFESRQGGPQGEEDANERNVISFRLQVKCTRQRPGGDGGGGDGGGPSSSGGGGGGGAAEAADGIIGSRVLSGDLEWIPQGEQEERFREAPIAPVRSTERRAHRRAPQAPLHAACAWCPPRLRIRPRLTALPAVLAASPPCRSTTTS